MRTGILLQRCVGPWGVLPLFALALLVGCGGKLSPDDDSVPASDTAATESASDASNETFGADATPSDVPPGPRCSLDDGTPTCGVAGCPGCELGAICAFPEREATDERLAFGACLPSKTYGATCGACDAAHPLCVSLGTDRELTCVPTTLCSEAARIGALDVCYYSDKTRWRPGQTIPTVACPETGSANRLCGGTCGSCSGKASCTGVSPTHPIGVCADVTTTRCARGAGECGAGNSCFVYFVGDMGDQSLADNLGFCLASDRCKAIASSLPGGAVCD